MALLFWVSVALVAYVYVGYPMALWLYARLRPSRRLALPPAQGPTVVSSVPGVSIVIAARNEGRQLAARIENLLALDYPADRRQIIIVSDGSTDETPDVLARYRNSVDSLALPPGGKAAALNAGVAFARFDIVVFTDARQTFARDALRHLVEPFADPQVGAVSGELLLDCEPAVFADRRAGADRRESAAGAPRVERRNPGERRSIASTIADGVGLYWRYEKALRQLESQVASMLGATGAIYAIRRPLWRPLPPATILDDVLTPMRVVLSGSRVVFNDRARACDRAPLDADAELRRKVRTLAGNWQILRLEPRLLSPWHNPVWVQYLSHKVGRLAVPYALLATFFTSIALSGQDFLYMGALAAQVAFYLLAACGAWLEHEGRTALVARRPAAAPSEALRAVR
jgi:cellulose synthase/poly-beta-1,6-N-acetylglucosamine synthase-like glycosyltransferase